MCACEHRLCVCVCVCALMSPVQYPSSTVLNRVTAIQLLGACGALERHWHVALVSEAANKQRGVRHSRNLVLFVLKSIEIKPMVNYEIAAESLILRFQVP